MMRLPVFKRLRPFLRRDLRARLVSALVAVVVLTGLCWLGVSALTKIDSREAHNLRIELALEDEWAVCNGPGQPECSYEDRLQARVDRKYHFERRVRLSVLEDLSTRIDHALLRLTDAESMLATQSATASSSAEGRSLRSVLREAVVDLRPAQVTPAEVRREEMMWLLDTLPKDCLDIAFDGIGWVGGCDLAVEGRRGGDPLAAIQGRIRGEREMLVELQHKVDRLILRDGPAVAETSTSDRIDVVADLTPSGPVWFADVDERVTVAGWLAATGSDYGSAMVPDVSGALPSVSTTLAGLARHHTRDLAKALTDHDSELWHGAWTDPTSQYVAIVKPTERYRSPVTSSQRWQLWGTGILFFAAVMLIIVGPVVTATTTAREREAGTLPVLRMTGMSAGDLAFAMAIGPNVFALVAGGVLLALAVPVLAFTAGASAVGFALAVLVAMAAAAHLTAIGLGDALGQRVNAMVVGGLLGLAITGPGLCGAVMVIGDMAATGLLLGPLPAVLGSIATLSGLPVANLSATSEMGSTILGYTLATQGLLGLLCLLSWRRRVEQAWAPLFRPIEGAALALASVGCSALAVLDLSERINVQTYDTVNLITFVATSFLMPVLGWLLVSSLVRPARAAAVASCSEARRAFGRFQLFVVLTAVALAGAYALVIERTGLGGEESEVMWATLTQGLLVAETTVATLLWASRRREGKHRIVILGAAVVLLQIVFAVAVYGLEVEHVAITQQAGMPFLYGMEASPYWMAFLVVLWAAGLGLILAALLRERDRAQAQADADDLDLDDGEDDDENGDGKGRWLH